MNNKISFPGVATSTDSGKSSRRSRVMPALLILFMLAAGCAAYSV